MGSSGANMNVAGVCEDLSLATQSPPGFTLHLFDRVSDKRVKKIMLERSGVVTPALGCFRHERLIFQTVKVLFINSEHGKSLLWGDGEQYVFDCTSDG